jgi:hypothetical protein
VPITTYFSHKQGTRILNGQAITIALLAIVLILRFLFDLKLAQKLIQFSGWIMSRTITRDSPASLSGDWEIVWESGGSEGFNSEKDRHGHPALYQAWRYVYGEFYSQGIKYALYGRLQGNYLTGEWYDIKDKNGYFGVFHVECVNSKLINGSWLGHSKKTREIRHDKITFTRVGE